MPKKKVSITEVSTKEEYSLRAVWDFEVENPESVPKMYWKDGSVSRVRIRIARDMYFYIISQEPAPIAGVKFFKVGSK